jgi:predicted esterase
MNPNIKFSLNRNKVFSTLIIISIFLTVIILYVRTFGYHEPVLTLEENDSSLYFIDDWTVIGPFNFDTSRISANNTYDIDDLIQFGLNENSFNIKNIKLLRKKGININNYNARKDLIDFKDLNKDLDIKSLSSSYLYSTIYCSKAINRVLIVDGSRNYKIWLNNEEICDIRNKNNVTKIGDRFINIRLNKGRNVLFVKVNRGTNINSWRFIASIAPLNGAKKIYRDNYFSDFIQSSIIDTSLRIYLGPNNQGVFKIFDRNDHLLVDSTFIRKFAANSVSQNYNSFNLCYLENGMYKFQLIFNNDTLNQWFYKGDIKEHIKNLYLTSKKNSISGKFNDDLLVLKRRIDFLLNNWEEDSESAIKYYHRNIVFWVVALERMINQIIINNTFYGKIYGTSLKSFRINDSSEVSSFLFHLNEGMNKKKIPLIIIIPYSISSLTFEESWYLGNLDQIGTDFQYSDMNNFAIAHLYIGGDKHYSIKRANDEIENVISRLKDEYNIDTTKVFLAGSCLGGNRALQISMNNPKYFAGVAVSSPDLLYFFNWNSKFDLQKLNNIPIHISHGIYDNNIPIESSRNFYEIAQEMDLSIELIETEFSHTLLTNEARKSAFHFFDSINKIN